MTDTQQVEQSAPAETNKAQITLNMLRQWGACQDGKSWFSNKFPQRRIWRDHDSAVC